MELVLFAFENAKQGDIFVEKAPAATIADLAQAIKEVFNADNEVKIIGTRHGEKVYETLLSREEMASAENLGNYYRIPADTRSLNYDKYFEQGNEGVSYSGEYNSHNTERLDISAIKELLLSLDYIREELKGW